jgi:histidine triad (HIT) family protein
MSDLAPFELPFQGNCIVCEIVSNGLDILDEQEETIAFLNVRQMFPGQAMISPKRHAPTLLDLTGSETSQVLVHAQRLARALVASLNPRGLWIYQNNGVISGQHVPHYHMHLVPVYEGDRPWDFSTWNHARPPAAAAELNTLAQRIKSHLD